VPTAQLILLVILAAYLVGISWVGRHFRSDVIALVDTTADLDYRLTYIEDLVLTEANSCPSLVPTNAERRLGATR
jgi:hypothetical protein